MMIRLIPKMTAGLGMLALFGCGGDNEVVPTGPAALTLAYARPTPAPGITIVQLPSLGTGSSVANAINDAQEIAGTSASFAARWTQVNGNWAATKLGAATGTATDINEAGTVHGSSGGDVTLWRRDGSSEVVVTGNPIALNESETVVGSSPGYVANAWTRANSVWTGHYLPPLANGGGSYPTSINNDGVIVGYSFDATNTQHAVKWLPSTLSPGDWDAAVPLDAHAGETNSAAFAIEGSEVVGLIFRCPSPSTCTSREGYYWSLSDASATGSLGSQDVWPQGLNADGFIIGAFSSTPRGRPYVLHAFIWSPAAPTIKDLGTLKGYSEAMAADINDATAAHAKQAVGQGTSGSGARAALLWIIP